MENSPHVHNLNTCAHLISVSLNFTIIVRRDAKISDNTSSKSQSIKRYIDHVEIQIRPAGRRDINLGRLRDTRGGRDTQLDKVRADYFGTSKCKRILKKPVAL